MDFLFSRVLRQGLNFAPESPNWSQVRRSFFQMPLSQVGHNVVNRSELINRNWYEIILSFFRRKQSLIVVSLARETLFVSVSPEYCIVFPVFSSVQVELPAMGLAHHSQKLLESHSDIIRYVRHLLTEIICNCLMNL
jgi:hypothetical protein